MLVGRGRAGKDEAGLFLQKYTTLRFAGTTSLYLAPYVAKEMGVSIQAAYESRHKHRMIWYEIGNRIRKEDPGLLIRKSLEHGEIVGGIRDIKEIQAVREDRLVDLIVWIERAQAPYDPTLKFGVKETDITILNHWSLPEFHERLARFARFAGLPLRNP